MKNWKITLPIFIALLVVIHFVSSYQLLEKSRFPRTFDQLGYLWSSYDLSCRQPVNFFKGSLISPDNCNPKLFNYAGAIFWKISNALHLPLNEILMILIPNFFFLIILLFSVYGIIKIIYEDRDLAILGAFLVSFTPIVFALTRIYMLDFPLMCMTALSVFMLLKTENFKSMAYSIAFGFVFFLAQLTKGTAILFILPVVLYYFIYSLKARESRKIAAVNFFVFVVSFIFLFVLTHYGVWQTCFPRYNAVPYIPTFPGPSTTYYPLSFLWVLFHPLLFLFIFILFIASLKSIRVFNKANLLLFWIVPALILFSVIPNKSARFLAPAVVPFIIFSLGVLKGRKRLKIIFSSLLIISSLFQWATLTYFPKFLNYPENFAKYQPPFLEFSILQSGIISAVREDGDMDAYEMFAEKLVRAIKSRSPKRVEVYSFFKHAGLEYAIWKRLLSEQACKWLFVFSIGGDCEFITRIMKTDAPEQYKSANFILYLERDNFSQFACEQEKLLLEKIKDLLRSDRDEGALKLVEKFSVKGQTFYLYEKPRLRRR